MDVLLNKFIELVTAVGPLKAVFITFFFGMHYWVHKANSGRLKDRQKEIERLTKENDDYRKRFIQLMDKNFDYKKNKSKKNKRSN